MNGDRQGIDWKKWRVVAGFYLVTNLAFVVQRVVFDLQRGMPLEIINSLIDLAGFAGIWIALAVPIIMLTSGRSLTPRNIALYFVVGILLSVAHGALYLLFAIQVPGLMQDGQIGSIGEFFSTFVGLAHAWRFLSFGFMVVASHAYDYYRLSIEREKKAVQLQVQLTEAKLNALKMQMHPHFLFNTLNAITVLVDENPAAAKTTLSYLSDLLRLALKNVGTQEVALKREMEFLDYYLRIQKIRYGERLTVRQEIPHATLGAAVPYLILQPLVENALKYGIDTVPGPGAITISAERRNGRLVLRVHDSGPGRNNPDGPEPGLGIGLANTRARLAQLYGAEQSVEMSPAAGKGGTNLTISFPYREAPPPDQGEETT
jgi:two-component system LytT family sensor kinase